MKSVIFPSILSKRSAAAAFTLVELMIILAVIIILALITVPSMSALYQHTRAKANIRYIQQTLQLARNQAINYAATVTVCPLEEGQCGDHWQQGMTLFFDGNDPNRLDLDDKIIYQTHGFNEADHVSYNRPSIRFQYNGMASGTNGTLKYCPSTPDSRYSQALIISQSGRIRLSDAGITCE